MIHSKKSNKFFIFLLSLIIFLTAFVNSAKAQYPNYHSYYADEVDEEEAVYDPFELVNRFTFKFNEKFYDYFGNYVIIGYRKVTTKDMRDSAVNFLDNIRSPITLLVSVVMLDPKRAGNVVSRFTINSTIGFLGLFDVATQMGIKNNKDDMGLAFGKYGVGAGPYLVIPFFGSYTLRSGIGDLAELAIDPLNFNVLKIGGEGSWLTDGERVVRSGVTLLTDAESIKDYFDDTRRDSFDPYATIRSYYLQIREEKVRRIREGE